MRIAVPTEPFPNNGSLHSLSITPAPKNEELEVSKELSKRGEGKEGQEREREMGTNGTLEVEPFRGAFVVLRIGKKTARG